MIREIILNRRSVREFEQKPVLKEHIEEIINCGIWAPSDTNSQPWKFVVVSNKDVIAKMEKATIKGMERLKQKALEINREDIIRKVDIFGKYALVFKNAPTVIVCLSKPYNSKFTQNVFNPIGNYTEMWKEEGIKSTCLAAQNIMLSAYALGYGTCTISGPMVLAEKEVNECLNVPDDYFISLLIAIGTPKGTIPKSTRKELCEVLEYID